MANFPPPWCCRYCATARASLAQNLDGLGRGRGWGGMDVPARRPGPTVPGGEAGGPANGWCGYTLVLDLIHHAASTAVSVARGRVMVGWGWGGETVCRDVQVWGSQPSTEPHFQFHYGLLARG